MGQVNSVDEESMNNNKRPTETVNESVTETPFRLSEPMVIEEPMDKEEKFNDPLPPAEREIDVKKFDDDDSPVKSLKILAQICVDELREMKMKRELNEKTESEIYVSSESDSDESSTQTENTSIQKDIEMTKQNEKCEIVDSESSTDHEESGSSASESDSCSSDDVESIMVGQDIVIPEPELIPCDPQIVEQPNENDYQIETQNDAINEVIELKSPTTLKELCKAVLDAHSMILQYEVPNLKYLCEHSMSMYGMEIPTFLFVSEDGVSAIETSETSEAYKEMESDNVYLRVEFDETELANLLNATEEPNCELSEYEETVNNADMTGNVSLIQQCVALESILSSPPHEHKVPTDGATEDVENSDYVYFEEENDNHHNVIQYEETVSQTDDNNMARMSVIAAVKFKKQLQSKYVQSSRYYQMFIVNHILKKYFKFVEQASAKKRTVRKRLKRTIRILDEKKRKREEEERQKAIKPQPIIARRRSARLLHKRRFSYCEERAFESMRAATEMEKVSKENQKPKEKNKTVDAFAQKENSNKQDTAQPIKRKPIENKTNNKVDKKSKTEDKTAKSKKVSNTVEEKKAGSKAVNDSSIPNNNNDKNNINNNVCVSELSINNSAPFRDDVLERIAQKRILKRRLSVCERSISRPNDDFCYDEDGQISEMLSSFINNGLDDQNSGPSAKKRLTSFQNNINMNINSNLTPYSLNMSNTEPKSLSSLLKSLPSIEKITFERDNSSSIIRPITPNIVPTTPKNDMQPKPNAPVITSAQSPFPIQTVKRAPPPRRKSCSASEWMVERSREYNFSPKNTFYREFNRERMSPGIEKGSRTDVQQQIINRTRRNSPVSRLSPQMRPNQDKFSPKINNNISTVQRRSPQTMHPNARLNSKRAWSPDRSMQPNLQREWSPIRNVQMQTNLRPNMQHSWSPIRTMQPNPKPNMQREWSPITTMQTNSRLNLQRSWSPDRSAQQFNPFRDRNRQMRTMPRAEPPRDRFEPYIINNRRMTNRGPPPNVPMRNPNPSQFRPNNDRFVPGVAFHTQNVPIKEYTTEKPNQHCNIQPPFQKQLPQPSAENIMHNCDPRLTSRVIQTSPVIQSPLNVGSPANQPSINVGLSPISKEPTPNQSPIIDLKIPVSIATEKIPPNHVPIASRLPSPPTLLLVPLVPNPPKHSPPKSLFVPDTPKHSPPKSPFVPNPPRHSPPKSQFTPNASKPIADPTQIYSLLQNCPAIENERRMKIPDEKTPANFGTGSNLLTQRNNTAIIIQNLLQSFAESNRIQNSVKPQEKSPTGEFIYYPIPHQLGHKSFPCHFLGLDFNIRLE